MPHAIVCLLSALQVHELTTEAPHAVWVLIDRHARLPKLSYPKLEVVRASGAAREHGVETRVIDGVHVRADKRRRRRLRTASATDATSGSTSRSRRSATTSARARGSMDALVEAARADRIYAFMRPYLEALA